MKFKESASHTSYKIQMLRDGMLPDDQVRETGWDENFAAGLGLAVDEDLMISQSLSKSDSPAIDWIRRYALNVDSNEYYKRNADLKRHIAHGLLTDEDVRASRERMGRGQINYDTLAGIAQNKGINGIRRDAEIDTSIRDTLKQRRDYAAGLQERATGYGQIGQFAGGMSALAIDPPEIVAGVIALPARAVTATNRGMEILRSFGRGAAAGAAFETALQPQIMSWKDEIESPYGLTDAMINIATSAGFSGTIDGAVAAVWATRSKLLGRYNSMDDGNGVALTPDQMADIEETLDELDEIMVDLTSAKDNEEEIAQLLATSQFTEDFVEGNYWDDVTGEYVDPFTEEVISRDEAFARAEGVIEGSAANPLDEIIEYTTPQGTTNELISPRSREARSKNENLVRFMDLDERSRTRKPNDQTHEAEANGEFYITVNDVEIDFNKVTDKDSFNKLIGQDGMANNIHVMMRTPDGGDVFIGEANLAYNTIFRTDSDRMDTPRFISRAQYNAIEDVETKGLYESVTGIYTSWRQVSSWYQGQGLSSAIQKAQYRIAELNGYVPTSDYTLTDMGVNAYVNRYYDTDNWDVYSEQVDIRAGQGLVASRGEIPNFIIAGIPEGYLDGDWFRGNIRRTIVDRDIMDRDMRLSEQYDADARDKAIKQEEAITSRESHEQEFISSWGGQGTARVDTPEDIAARDVFNETVEELRRIQTEMDETIEVPVAIETLEDGTQQLRLEPMDDFIKRNEEQLEQLRNFLICRRNNG